MGKIQNTTLEGIKKMISNGDLMEALNEASIVFANNTRVQKNLVLHKSQLNRLLEGWHLGFVEFSHYNTEINKINDALLLIIKENESQIQNRRINYTGQQNKVFLLILPTLLFAYLGVLNFKHKNTFIPNAEIEASVERKNVKIEPILNWIDTRIENTATPLDSQLLVTVKKEVIYHHNEAVRCIREGHINESSDHAKMIRDVPQKYLIRYLLDENKLHPVKSLSATTSELIKRPKVQCKIKEDDAGGGGGGFHGRGVPFSDYDCIDPILQSIQ